MVLIYYLTMPATTFPPRPPAQTLTPAPIAPRLSSEHLFSGRREIEIEHAGQIYRLRMTALGKLILTK